MAIANPLQATESRRLKYAGRLHRAHPDKRDVLIYDYVDSQLQVLRRMFAKRLRAYRSLGYELVEPAPRVLAREPNAAASERRVTVAIKIRGCVRFSRHARNEMRLYRISTEDVEATVTDPAGQAADERGNARLIGETGDGRPILVVVAKDEPNFVITVFLRS